MGWPKAATGVPSSFSLKRTVREHADHVAGLFSILRAICCACTPSVSRSQLLVIDSLSKCSTNFSAASRSGRGPLLSARLAGNASMRGMMQFVGPGFGAVPHRVVVGAGLLDVHKVSRLGLWPLGLDQIRPDGAVLERVHAGIDLDG